MNVIEKRIASVMWADTIGGKMLITSRTMLMCEECEDVSASHADAGSFYQFAAVVDGLLCGLVGKIVARLEENCKRLLGDEFDRAGVGCGLV